MRVLGIEITGTTIHWLLLEGDSTSGSIHYLPEGKLQCPISGSRPGQNYILLKNIIVANLRKSAPDKVSIIKADVSSGVGRTKMECIVEIACEETGVPCDLIHANSIANIMKKKFIEVVGDTPENAYNNGEAISPKYLTKAFFCAWKGLNG